MLNFDGAPLTLTEDHKPNRPEEAARIRAAGGEVYNIQGVWRVGGTLAISRAFGDQVGPIMRTRSLWHSGGGLREPFPRPTARSACTEHSLQLYTTALIAQHLMSQMFAPLRCSRIMHRALQQSNRSSRCLASKPRTSPPDRYSFWHVTVSLLLATSGMWHSHGVARRFCDVCQRTKICLVSELLV